MGPFFKKLDNHLRAAGAQTFRICFNGGDRFFANPDNRFDYQGKTRAWKPFVRDFCSEKNIEAIILYGDSRFYHRVAMDVAAQSGIQVFVFEEGYVRPNFITLEENGVNAQSAVSRDKDFYSQLEPRPVPQAAQQTLRYSYYRWAFFTIVYFLCMQWWRHRYPFNQHHRNTNIALEIAYGIRNGLRKMYFALTEKPFLTAIASGMSKRYFLAVLQVQYDFQISRHSRFASMEDFIRTVMVSFYKHAPCHAYLVFKHHPMDRGRPLFYGYIRRLAKRMGVSKRVVVVHDVHLPTCLKNAKGTITINSTVGIASLFHGTPTIVLGDALYDIDGLTCKGLSLDHFWSNQKAPNRRLFQQFRGYLIEKTQLYGSFYNGFPEQLN